MIKLNGTYVSFDFSSIELVKKSLPHEVVIIVPKGVDREQVNYTLYHWCRQKCKSFFTDIYGDTEDGIEAVFYRFADGKEAMHFKLIFGG